MSHSIFSWREMTVVKTLTNVIQKWSRTYLVSTKIAFLGGASVAQYQTSTSRHNCILHFRKLTFAHTHTHTQPRYSSPCTCCSVYSTDTAAAQDLFTLYHPTEKGSKGELNTAGYDMICVQTQGLHFGVFN